MNEGRRTFAISILVLAGIAAFAFWARQGEGPAVADLATPEPKPGPPAAAASAALAPTTERTEAATTAPTPPPAAAADPTLAHVRGRCVDEKGAPLVACTVKLDAWGGNTNRMALQGKVDWHDPEPIVTGDDGHFDFAFAPPSGMQFALDVSAEGRVPRTGRWGQLDPGKVIDLGDIALGRGFPVRGRVVDEQGLPVAKVAVGIQNLPLPIALDMAANDSRHGFSDANGEFTIGAPLPVGTWSIEAQARGMRHVSPAQVTVTERGAEPLLVTVRSMPSIQGLVVDEQGQPVKGVVIEAELNRSGRMASARSRDDGTFTIFAVDAEPKPVKLRIDEPGPCEPPAKVDERLWEWGSKDVRFELRRALTCELLVVERATGAPVTQFAVSCYAKTNSSRYTDLRLSGEHPDGRVTIDRVWRGTNWLQVMPLDRALLPSAVVEFVATDAGAPPQRVEVDRLAAATVLVTTANGTPIVGSKVEVIVKGTMPWNADAWVQDSRSGNRGHSSDPKMRFHEQISQAVTGADGRAAAFVPPTAADLVVRVTGDHPPVVLDPATFAIGQDLVVVPPAAGSIRGVVRVQGLDASRILVSRHAGDAGARANFDKPISLQPDATFAIRGMAPGRYQLRLTYSVPFRTEHGGSSGGASMNLPEIDLVVQADQETPVEIDATAIVPGSVSGRVLLDGAVPAAARVFVQAERSARYGQFVVGSDGSFTADGLLPGRYRVGLVVGDFLAGEGDTILQDEWFELAAGQQLVRDFPFVRRRLVVTLLQADGKTPAVGVTCFCSGEGVWLRDLTTDAQGRLVIDPAPSVPLRLQPRTGRVALGPVQVPAGQTSHEVSLTLPATPDK